METLILISFLHVQYLPTFSYDLQVAWIDELHRILREGGLVYFSTHGNRKAAEDLTEADRELMRGGKLVVKNPNSAGMNRCAVYESRDFVVKELLGKFAFG